MTLPDMNVNRNGLIAYAIGATVVVLDQLSKTWVLHGLNLAEVRSIPILPPIFRFSLLYNDGMSFGLLHATGDLGRWFLTLFGIGMAAGFAWWSKATDRALFAVAAGLLMGGSIGNVIDRFRLHAVVDFLDFSGLGFNYIFNVADCGVTVGATLLLVEAFWPSLKSELPSLGRRLRAVLASLRVRGN